MPDLSRDNLIHLIVPVLTVVAVVALSAWIVIADPGPNLTPSTEEKARPQPSMITDFRLVQVAGKKENFLFQSATTTFDFTSKRVNYEKVSGHVRIPDLGLNGFKARRGFSPLNVGEQDAGFSELDIEVIELDGSAETTGVFAARHQAGLIVDLKNGRVDSKDSEGNLAIPADVRPSGKKKKKTGVRP